MRMATLLPFHQNHAFPHSYPFAKHAALTQRGERRATTMDCITSFLKDKLRINSNGKSNTISTDDKRNNNIRSKSMLAMQHVLPKEVWTLILSLLLPDSLNAIAFTCSYMYHHTEQPSMWIAALARVGVRTTTLPPPFTSWRSFWMNKKKLTWKNIREKVKIVERSLPAHSKPVDERLIKCVLFGNIACGKTCLVTKVSRPEYFNPGFCNSRTTTPNSTIGASFATIPILCSIPPLSPLHPLPPTTLPSSPPLPSASSSTTPPACNVMLEVWDTNGLHPRNERDAFPEMYLRKAHAVMIVYDVTEPSSFFDGVDVWRQLTVKHAPTAPMLLAALKVDLPRKIPQDTAMQYAQEHGMGYVEISTKTEYNITLPFLFFGYISMNTFAAPLLPFLNDSDGLANNIQVEEEEK